MTTGNAMKRRRARKHEAGAVLLDLAILLPLLMLLLLGGVDFARVFFAAVELGNAASAGAEYGARTTDTAIDYTGMTNTVTGDAANLSGVTVTPTPTSYCTCPGSTTHIGCTTTCSG